MECWYNLIGREYGIAACRAEVKIDAGTCGRLNVEFSQMPILIQYGSAFFSTHVHHGQIRILPAMDMAVHAAIAHLPETADGPLVEVLYAAFVDFQVLEHFVIRFNESVGEP